MTLLLQLLNCYLADPDVIPSTSLKLFCKQKFLNCEFNHPLLCCDHLKISLYTENAIMLPYRAFLPPYASKNHPSSVQ